MNIKEHIFGMTFKSVFRRKLRSGLTILSIVIGIMLVTSLLMLANGLVTQFQQINGEGDFVIMDRGAPDLTMSRVDIAAKNDIENINGVYSVSAMTFSLTSLKDRPFVIIIGVNPNEQAIKQFNITNGRTLQPNDKGKIIIGRTISAGEELNVGDTVYIHDTPFEIVGIYETGNTLHDGGGAIPINEAQYIFGMENEASMLSVNVEDLNQLDDIRSQIEDRFPQLITLKGPEVAAQQQDLRLIQGISSLIALVAIVVSSMVVMNTMVMSVMERTREIGILRAIGWKKKKILSMVLKEALIISIVGGILGIVLAIGVVNVLVQAAELPIALPITANLVISIFLMVVIVGVLGGLYPAWRASKMSPMEALSRE